MKSDLSKACPQTKRALRLLLSPDAPRIDQQKLIEALPGPTPIDQKELIDLIIQIVLALMENKDSDKPDKPNNNDDLYEHLKQVAKHAALQTVQSEIRERDIPKLVTSIRSVAAIIPIPRSTGQRSARESMRVANNLALGESATNWITWNSAVRIEMNNLEEAGLLTELSEYKRAWNAIATALETIL